MSTRPARPTIPRHATPNDRAYVVHPGMTPCYSHAGMDVYHGDGAEVLRQDGIAGTVDLIVTSPPYGALRDYGGHGFDFETMAGACVAALAPGGVIVWVVGDSTVDGSELGTPYRQALWFLDHGDVLLHDTMIYRKRGNGGRPWPNRHSNGFEFMFVLSKGKPRTANIIRDVPALTVGRLIRSATLRQKDGTTHKQKQYTIPDFIPRDNVWTFSQQAANGTRQQISHPAPFPVLLAKDHIRTWSNPGDLVADPMAGSGTTLRAAKELGRRAVGVEIHADYIPIITDRLSQDMLDLCR